MATFEQIMSGWTTAKEFMKSAAFVCDTKKKADAVITHLAASAIKLALDEVKAGRPGTSTEANGLLWFCLSYRKKEAQLLRAYLLNFGPFVSAPDVVSLDIDGKKVVIEKGCGVRFNQKKCEAKFSEKTPEEYALEAKRVQFTDWKQAMKAENTSKKEDGSEKSDTEKQEDVKKRLQGRIDRALKEAEEQGIILDLHKPEKEIVQVRRKEISISELPEVLMSVKDEDKLPTEVKEMLDQMLGIALRMVGKTSKSEEKAA